MAKFTKSQWQLADEDKSTFVYALNEKGFNQFSLNVSGCGNHTSIEELHANAKLIAAAPDMLIALETLLERFGPAEDSFIFSKRMAIQKCRAAVAKATQEYLTNAQ